MSISDRLAKNLAKGIQEQMDRCPYHDVIVIVEDTEFKCHRFLLSACSDFFQALFQSGMKEALDNKVVLRNISSNVFKLIIDSVYFAKEILTPENVSSVWHAASQLQIGYLLEACEIFQRERLSRDNCVFIHIDSKFLSAKKLQELSWDVIIKEFDHLRKVEDILYLDFEDMKRLVRDDNLTISYEDVVIETVMRWVMFNPNKCLTEDLKGGDKVCELYQGESPNAVEQVKDFLKDSRDPSQNKQDNAAKVLKNKEGSDCRHSVTNFSLNNRRDGVVFNRRGFLFELLTASKLFLVSQACLLNLLDNKLVWEDLKSFALIREGLRYILQLSSRHSYCPLYAIYRNKSVLQNVVFTASWLNPVPFSCRTLDGKWYLLSGTAHFKCKAVTYGKDIFFTSASGITTAAHKYDTSTNTWRSIAPLTMLRKDHALVCLDNFIYAFGGVNCTSIERFDVEAEQKVPGSGKWENFGNLVQPMTNLMATTCKNMIVIFGSNIEDSPSIIVQSFNPQFTSATIVMDNMPGSAKNMISFKHGEETFVLQENGALSKVNIDSSLLLNIEFHTTLWSSPFTLNGAVVTNQELLVFGVNIDPEMSREWEVCNFEHFKRIKIVERQGHCFLNTVIPKKFLVTPLS